MEILAAAAVAPQRSSTELHPWSLPAVVVATAELAVLTRAAAVVLMPLVPAAMVRGLVVVRVVAAEPAARVALATVAMVARVAPAVVAPVVG